MTKKVEDKPIEWGTARCGNCGSTTYTKIIWSGFASDPVKCSDCSSSNLKKSDTPLLNIYQSV